MWQTVEMTPAGSRTALLTWDSAPPLVDGGVPRRIARAVARALTSVGAVAFRWRGPVTWPDRDTEVLQPRGIGERVRVRLAGGERLVVTRAAAVAACAFEQDWELQGQVVLALDAPPTRGQTDELWLRDDWRGFDLASVAGLIAPAVDGAGILMAAATEERLTALIDAVNAALADDDRASLTGRVEVVVGDITELDVDVMVNAANEALARGGGVCGAIFAAAGPRLDTACRAVAPCPTGGARLTAGFETRARWIAHAVGPVWNGGTNGEDALLAGAYTAALSLAASVGATSIAFPAISTGIYGFPFERAAPIAIGAARAWASENQEPDRVLFVFRSAADAAVYERLLAENV
jgi:O-acetyl-ADP-ribose deacetylase (regulator of RNase III)